MQHFASLSLSNIQADKTSTNVTFTFDISNITPRFQFKKTHVYALKVELIWCYAEPLRDKSDAHDFTLEHRQRSMYTCRPFSWPSGHSGRLGQLSGPACTLLVVSLSGHIQTRGRACPLEMEESLPTGTFDESRWGYIEIHRCFSEASAGDLSHTSTIRECEIEGERPSVQRKILCICGEPKCVRNMKKGQDDCWLLTCMKTVTISWRYGLFTRGTLQKQISSFMLQEFPIRILQVSLHRVLHCQKSQSSTSRWLRPDSRLASPEGESCSWELS